MTISAWGAAVAEGCQEGASALSDLKNSPQGYSTDSSRPYPGTPCPGPPPNPGTLAQGSNVIPS